MEILEKFTSLFIEVWKNGISGVNISEIIIAILIFFLFLLLRGIFTKFVVRRLEKYVARTTNNFDNSLVSASNRSNKIFSNSNWFFCGY